MSSTISLKKVILSSMRPLTLQSHLRFPLTHFLGNEGSVRVLRVLIAYGGPLSVSQLARDSGLSPQGTRQTLDSLVGQRLVKVFGQSRSQVFAIDPQNPLSRALKELFGYEQARWDALLEELRETLRANKAIDAAWYYGSVARGEDTQQSDFDIVAVASDGLVDDAVESVRQALREVEDRLYVSCSVVGLSHSDVARLSDGDEWWQSMARDAKVLKGAEPGQYATNIKPKSAPI